MTNYNERLDEILDWGQAARAEADIVIRGLDTSNGSYVQERLGEIRLSHKNKAKQATTSLIKELVAGAKPYRQPPMKMGNPTKESSDLDKMIFAKKKGHTKLSTSSSRTY